MVWINILSGFTIWEQLPAFSLSSLVITACGLLKDSFILAH